MADMWACGSCKDAVRQDLVGHASLRVRSCGDASQTVLRNKPRLPDARWKDNISELVSHACLLLRTIRSQQTPHCDDARIEQFNTNTLHRSQCSGYIVI